MADKNRHFNTTFWSDEYILNQDPSVKLVFSYLFTNGSVNWCGIYKIASKKISMETGFEKETLLGMLKKLEADGKIKYQDGWIALKNFVKHNKYKGNIQKAFINDFNDILMKGVPDELLAWTLNGNLIYQQILRETKAFESLRKPSKALQGLPYSYSYSYSYFDFNSDSISSEGPEAPGDVPAEDHIVDDTQMVAEPDDVSPDPEKEIRKKIIATFYHGYPEIHGEKIALAGKEIGAVTHIVALLKKMGPADEWPAIVQGKCDTLARIARAKNKYQPWMFLPSMLLTHWNQLIPDNVISNKRAGPNPADRLRELENLETGVQRENIQ